MQEIIGKYWIVGGDDTQFYSSSSMGFVNELPEGWHATAYAAADNFLSGLGIDAGQYGPDELLAVALEHGFDLTAVRLPTRIASMAELSEVLRSLGAIAPVPNADDVIKERSRRFALGFDFDFGDSRGVHHIGTTPSDMEGWDEVSKSAQAAINLGMPEATLEIYTNTGAVVITAMEWQSILGAATLARQPIWLASFALQAMNPIPADFRDDSYWGS